MDEAQWDSLLSNVLEGDCVPFLGAGIAKPCLPTGAELARELASEAGYPFDDKSNLARVAQYIASGHRDPLPVKRQVIKSLGERERLAIDRLGDPDEPHSILAALRLSVYVTTNYDALMYEALRRRPDTTAVHRELSRWNPLITAAPTIDIEAMSPTRATPLVFHMHGHSGMPASLVLTEDDYVNYLVKVSDKQHMAEVLPGVIQEQLVWKPLLFIGYSLEDWNFRVLMRALARQLDTMQRLRISVQLPPDPDIVPTDQHDRFERALSDYLGVRDVVVVWQQAADFMKELRARLRERGSSG